MCDTEHNNKVSNSTRRQVQAGQALPHPSLPIYLRGSSAMEGCTACGTRTEARFAACTPPLCPCLAFI